MRRRLVVVFLVPLVGVLLVLGGAYAWSTARSIQQEHIAELVGDVAYFVTTARQALRSGSPELVAREAERYAEVYDTRVLVVDRSGAPWATSGESAAVVDEGVTAQIQLALAGRRGDLPQPGPPWEFTNLVIVEPVLDNGDAIGAVVVEANVDVAREAIVEQWVLLLVGAALATTVGLVIVFRLSDWVLRPVRRVDSAMEAMERGDIASRIADDTGPPELRRMIRLFNSMADEIERTMSRQQEFALNASHELRNPLGALLVRVEHLAPGLDDHLTLQTKDRVEVSGVIVPIIDTLLSLARSSGRSAAAEKVDVASVVRERVDAWRDAASQSRVSILTDGAASVELVTDRMIVEGALDAVIDNAVKFSPAGARVVVAVERTDEGATILVRDNGPGVDTEELAHLTDRFWRSPRNRTTQGSGLGLAIATDLLHSIGGALVIDAPDDGGLAVSLHVSDGGTL